MNIFCFYRS